MTEGNKNYQHVKLIVSDQRTDTQKPVFTVIIIPPTTKRVKSKNETNLEQSYQNSSEYPRISLFIVQATSACLYLQALFIYIASMFHIYKIL